MCENEGNMEKNGTVDDWMNASSSVKYGGLHRALGSFIFIDMTVDEWSCLSLTEDKIEG